MGAAASHRLKRLGAVAWGSKGAAVLVLALAGLWLFSSALFSGRVLAGDDILLFTPPMSEVRPAGLANPSNELNFDSAHVFHPDLMAARRAVRNFELPAWTNQIGAGRPLLAAQQSAPLFPTNLPAYVLPFWDSLEVTALLKVLLAALGMLLFCRSLGLRRGPALLGAVTFAFSTYFVVWLAHPHTNVYLLLPWLLLAIRTTVWSATPPAAAGLGLVLGLALLGGHPPSLVLVGLLAVPYAILEVVGCRSRLRAVGLLAGGVALGFAIGAVMLLPLLEGLAHTIDPSVRGGEALPRSAANAFAFPELWGRPDKFETGTGPSNFQERTGYFGVLPLLLALAGLTVRPARRQVFFALAGAAAVGIVFIQRIASSVDELPGLTSTNLGRCLILIVFCGAVLAAFGLQRLIEADRRERLRIAVVAAGMVALIGCQWLLRHTEARSALGDAVSKLPVLDDRVTGPDAVQLAAVLRWCLLGAAAVLIVALTAWKPRLISLAVGLAIALAIFDLISMGRGYHPAVDRTLVDTPDPPSVRFLQRAGADGSRSLGEGFTYPANLSHRFGTLDPREHELPSVERTQRVWLGLGGIGVGNTQQRKIFPAQPGSDRLADVFAVRWLYSPTLAGAPRPGYRPVPGQVNIVENLDAFPRAWVAHSWRAAADFEPALAAVVASSSRELLASPVIEGVASRAAGAAPEPAVVESEGADEVRLRANSSQAGFLILADTFYPGWKAEVDGHDEPIRPANGSFRAIPIAAGRHEVRFAYESAAVRWGWTATLLGLACAAGIGAVALARRRRKPGSASGTDPPVEL